MSREEIGKRLISVYEKWGQVQGRLKEAEQINQLAVVPAINELRYAGRLLVEALANEKLGIDLKSANTTKNDENLHEAVVIAEQYITNADHDISDALVYFFQSRADEINGRFGAGAVVKRYNEYEHFLDKLEEARKLIIRSREDISSRMESYAELEPIVRFLIGNYFILDKTDAFMSIEISQHQEAQKKMQIFCWAMAFVTILASAYSIHSVFA